MKYKAFFRKLEAEQLLNQERYNKFVKKCLPTLRCPRCSCPHFTFHDTYDRHLYKSREERTIIRVNRMKCCSCFRTFVLLPESVIPHKRYLLTSLISFLAVVLEVNKTVCRKWFDLNNHYIDFLMRQYHTQHEKWIAITGYSFPPDDPLAFGVQYHHQIGVKFMQVIPATFSAVP